jgi:DNA modification methylase
VLLRGNCLETLKTLPDASVDSIVTDPPYELRFMNKSWDASGIAYNADLWAECLRVLKPGGHLLAFSGSRTYHRMTVAIEDAGFEIRDQIMYLYGSGFPKSLDVSKAIDKGMGENRQRQLRFTEWMRSTGITAKQIDEATGTNMGGHYLSSASQPAIATADLFDLLRPLLPEVPEEIERLVAERTGIEWTAYKNREVVGSKTSGIANKDEGPRYTIGASKSVEVDITAPATPEAQRWQGWGTALKPAHEPICVARKPLVGTVANNVLTYGTGALNIDGTRVGYADGDEPSAGKRTATFGTQETVSGGDGSGGWEAASGRWPANVIHDGSDEVLAGFPTSKSAPFKSATTTGERNIYGSSDFDYTGKGYSDEGSAARFFANLPINEADARSFIYCAKASKAERNAGLEGLPEKRESDRERDDGVGGDNPRNRTNTPRQNFHPTVKPLALMRYLIKLVTPPGGTVLDPFLGSGSTAVAAVLEGFQWIGCEMTEDYFPIIEARVAWAEAQPKRLLPNL